MCNSDNVWGKWWFICLFFDEIRKNLASLSKHKSYDPTVYLHAISFPLTQVAYQNPIVDDLHLSGTSGDVSYTVDLTSISYVVDVTRGCGWCGIVWGNGDSTVIKPGIHMMDIQWCMYIYIYIDMWIIWYNVHICKYIYIHTHTYTYYNHIILLYI